MEYQFSFSDKQELIFLNNQPYINEIGSLLIALVDTDWSINHIQSEMKLHPAYSYYLSETDSIDDLKGKLKRLTVAQGIAFKILETLIDEQGDLYEEKLSELLSQKSNDYLRKQYLKLGEAILMPLEKRSQKIYKPANEFPYLFETDDILSIVVQEMNFLICNKFLFRRCAYCKKFFVTRKTNQTYCKREISYLKKTCSQLGPMKQWQNKRAEPYKLYWNYRMRIFNRDASDKDPNKFKEWTRKTNEYKELAKTNNITLEELEFVLGTAEKEVYGT